MGYSEDMRARAASIWESEQSHPFVAGIGDGTLSLDRFKYYMCQDYVFLIDFCRAISLAVAKSPGLEEMGWFARLIHETLNTEMALHVSFCADFGITEEELLATDPSPTTWAYTRHMINTAHQGTVGETAAVILPCSWGYSEIGQKLYSQGLSARSTAIRSLDRDVQLPRVRGARRMAARLHRPARRAGRKA